MERAKGSAAWRYFMLDTSTSLAAVCNVCKANVSRGGGGTAKYTTTSYADQILPYTNSTKARQIPAAQQNQRSRRHCSLAANFCRCTSMMQKVSDFFLDAQPMSVVKDKGFRRPLEYLEQRYSLPSCKCFSETFIQFIINSTWYRIIIGY